MGLLWNGTTSTPFPHRGCQENAGTPVLESFIPLYWRARCSPAGGLLTTAAVLFSLSKFSLGSQNYLPRDSLRSDEQSSREAGSGLIARVLDGLSFHGAGHKLRYTKNPSLDTLPRKPEFLGHIVPRRIVWVDPSPTFAWAILGSRTYSNLWNQHGLLQLWHAILASYH